MLFLKSGHGLRFRLFLVSRHPLHSTRGLFFFFFLCFGFYFLIVLGRTLIG